MSVSDLFLSVRLRLVLGATLSLLLSLGLTLSCAPSSDGGDDGGVSDAGAEEADGGDAGDDPRDMCVDLDPVLGSLTLADGFSIIESAPLPAGIAALHAHEEDDGWRLFAVDFLQDAVVDLGRWPELSPSPAKRFDVLPPDLDDDGAMVSWFLASDGARLVTGYTGTFDPEALVAPGAIALYDLTPGVAEPLTFLEAANNYAATFVGDALVLNASSLDDVEEGTAIYGLTDSARVLARYEDPTSTYGGPLIATADDGLVVGGYDANTGLQRLHWIAPEDVSAALVGEPLALVQAEEVLAAPALTAARFGSDLAYAHGDYFNPFEGVRRVSLGEGARGAIVDVLTAEDGCTSVDLLAPLGDDLLVSVSDDEGGLRLVRIREDG